jgi:hypothetical protein
LQQQFGKVHPAFSSEAWHVGLEVRTGGLKDHLIKQPRNKTLHNTFGSMKLLDNVAVSVGFNEIVHFEVVCNEMLLELSRIVYAFEVEYAQ